MRKLSLFVTALVVMLLTACSSGAATASTPTESEPVVTSTPTSVLEYEAPATDNNDDRDAVNDLLGDLFDILEENPPVINGGSSDCNPLSPTCLYDPFYGSCEWDYWRGVYTCDSYHYRPDYDCSYDWWYGEYVCREGDGYGGWGSSWGW